ncbi:unnamed protein product, partial [Acanthoscelides obtectus]
VQVSKTKVWQTLREEGLYPLHVQRVQALQPDDFPARVRFCEWLLHQHDNNPDFLKCILVTDESTFTRNGVNNFRNTHVWSVENPYAVRRAHFQQTFSVNVWAGMVNDPPSAASHPNRIKLPPHQSTISRWYGEFKRGRVSLSDDPRMGAPKTAVTQENFDAISKTSIQKILLEGLGVRKLVSRWIPHLLTEKQKAARVNWYQKNVYSIVSGDESWICCYEPENKRQSAIWVFQGEEKPTKIICSRSVSKKMVATFVLKAGHIATITLNEQRTVTADWYTTICLPKVITELRKIKPGKRIILHQDNASSHTAQKTRQYLTEENFFTFPKIKNRLRGQRFQSPEEAWNKCFENWFEHLQMCINLRGEYFKKQ